MQCLFWHTLQLFLSTYKMCLTNTSNTSSFLMKRDNSKIKTLMAFASYLCYTKFTNFCRQITCSGFTSCFLYSSSLAACTVTDAHFRPAGMVVSFPICERYIKNIFLIENSSPSSISWYILGVSKQHYGFYLKY